MATKAQLKLEIKTLNSHFLKLMIEASKVMRATDKIQIDERFFAQSVYAQCQRILSD